MADLIKTNDPAVVQCPHCCGTCDRPSAQQPEAAAERSGVAPMDGISAHKAIDYLMTRLVPPNAPAQQPQKPEAAAPRYTAAAPGLHTTEFWLHAAAMLFL